MKTRYWIGLFGILLLICAALSLWLLWPQPEADQIQIICDGEVLHTLSLSEDQELTITSAYGTNTVTIQDGKVAVTTADCPDHICQDRGWCTAAPDIVCLPNRLQIHFLDTQAQDAIVQ
ncbi:MAG: NusG domain II-containing protein [Oscillospiraceae bacterium]|nr:NusG domain II-containing protein [Oscillospiraceae bacterium]